MRILVTGGAGFIGSNIAKRLAKDGTTSVLSDGTHVIQVGAGSGRHTFAMRSADTATSSSSNREGEELSRTRATIEPSSPSS